MELLSLQGTIQHMVVTLLSDPDNIVKQTLLESGIKRLCVFFGRQKGKIKHVHVKKILYTIQL